MARQEDDGADDFLAEIEQQENSVGGDDDDAPRMMTQWSVDNDTGIGNGEGDVSTPPPRQSESMMRRMQKLFRGSTTITVEEPSRGSSLSRLISVMSKRPSSEAADEGAPPRGSSLSRFFGAGKASKKSAAASAVAATAEQPDHSEFDIESEEEAMKLAAEARARKYGHVFADAKEAPVEGRSSSSVVRSELWERKISLGSGCGVEVSASPLCPSSTDESGTSNSTPSESSEVVKDHFPGSAVASEAAVTGTKKTEENCHADATPSNSHQTSSPMESDHSEELEVIPNKSPVEKDEEVHLASDEDFIDPYDRFRWMLSAHVPEAVRKLEHTELFVSCCTSEKL